MIEMKRGTATDMFDVAKYVLSLFVVAVHIPLLPELLNPIVRVAVPLFFMMSSYFFWKKATPLKENQRSVVLRRFLKRNLQLYGFWFVVLLPITLKVRGYFADGILVGLMDMMQDFLFYSTFRASWYIMALCIGMVIMCYLSKKIPYSVLLAAGTVIHLVMCLFSNYYGLISGCDNVVAVGEAYQALFVTVCNSFPVSFLWILLGKGFTQGKISLSRSKGMLIAALSFVLVCVEHVLVVRFDLQAAATDYYVFLVPLCIGLFSLIQGSEMRCDCAIVLRKMSTVTYALHSSLIVIVSLVCRKMMGLNGTIADLVEFTVVVLLCAVVSVVIMKLENRRGWRWLKWAH